MPQAIVRYMVEIDEFERTSGTNGEGNPHSMVGY